MRICRHQDHRQHHDRHHAAAVYVCLHWSAAFQGTEKRDTLEQLLLLQLGIVIVTLASQGDMSIVTLAT